MVVGRSDGAALRGTQRSRSNDRSAAEAARITDITHSAWTDGSTPRRAGRSHAVRTDADTGLQRRRRHQCT